MADSIKIDSESFFGKLLKINNSWN